MPDDLNGGKTKVRSSDPLDAGETQVSDSSGKEVFSVGSLFVGRYRILAEGIPGGMGVVYKCRDEKLNETTALKVIHPRLLRSEEALKRFRQEVSISRKLSHEGIVRVHDIGSHSGLEYFTMEWVEGESLRDILDKRKKKGKPFSLQEAYEILQPLTEALHYAHRYTVHRDLKPENILITQNNRVKLTDFGIAKTLTPSQLTSTNIRMGTPYYMAPEQKTDAGHVDHRADIYSLGVVLFELITLENTMGPELPSDLNPELPKGIDGVFRRAVALKHEDRYPDVKSFILELEKIIPFEATGKESRKIEDPSQKKKLKIQALLLIVVVCLVGLIIIFFSKYFENKEIGSHNMGNENTGVGKEGPKIFTSPYLEAQFVLIPKGEFIMGANEGVYYERKEHNVILSRPFYIQTTEITQGQWKKVMGKNPSLFSNCGDDCPVENVSWNDIQSFIGRVNSNEGTNKYRLPTEAEWEYAARAGTKTRFYTGRCISASQANFSFYDIGGECPKGGALGKPTKVASYPPNPWGLYDMSGNIAEWVQDWYGIYSEGKVMDPEGDAIQKDKVIRGGNWHTTAYSSAVRNYAPPDHRDQYTGFRLARTY